MTDTEGRILDVNQAYAKLSGYTREELLTMRALDLKADGDQEEVRRNLAEIALRGSHRFEATHRRKDGSVWPVEYTASYLPINGGRLFAFLRDIGERKQQEEQVNRLLTENQTILGNALVGIVYLRHRRIVSCNRRLEEIFQYEPGELIGESTERFYDSRETYDHIGIVAYRDGAESKGYTGDVRLRHKDGSLFWGTLSGRAIDPAHPQEGSIWVYTDITERKLAESANQRDREQQEALRRMLEIALDNSGVESALTRMLDLLLSVSWLALLPRGGIFLSDEDGEGLRLAAARNLDPAVQASCTRVPYGLCHCGRAAASGEIQYAPRVDARHEITHAGMTNHGHYCIPIVSETRKLGVLMLYLPVDTARDPYAEGFLESVAGILASYLLRSEAEQALLDHRQSLEESVRLRTAALHMSEARSRAILGTMLDGVVHIDPDGTMLTVNDAILGMFGYEEDELLGRNVRMLMPEPYASAHDGYLRGYERTRQSTIVGRRREVEALRKDGSRFPIELAVNEMIDDDGNTFIGLIRDMTAQKADERELQDALRTAQAATQAKGRFLANMSHEVRTPLNAVLGLAQIGMRNSAGSPAGIAFGRIADAGEHLLAVVNDILDFSKIEAGKLKIERQPFALHATTDRLVSFMADRAEAKGLTLTVTLAPDLPKWVAGDELRVAQILTNLVSNAIKFTASGEVSLRVACEGDDTWFMVSDTGIGMDESQLARLFRPFEQADGSTTRNYGGTGLGLAISLDLARLMGGDIEVESRPGMGSTFTLYLPLPAAEAPERSTAPSLEEGATLSGLLILAADDVEINRLVLEDLLMHEGAQVVFATNGLQAVERLERDGADAFDLVLMDVQMPVMDGIEATRRIRAMAPLLPVLGLTAHALAEEREKCMDAGMVDVATKPINLKSLVAAIRRQVPPGRQRRPHSGEPVAAAAPRPRSGIDGRQSEATESESAPARPIPSGTFSVPPMGPAGTAVDWQALLARYDGREDFIIKLAASVFGHHADTPAQLRAAVEQGDRSSLIFTTHSLKGIGGNIEARRLHQLAKSMEANLRAGQDIDRERVAELVTELETVLAELVIWNQQKGST
jgi:PAS domain S-box-containing protein